MKTVEELAQDLELGRTTSATLVEEALEKIKDPMGEGARAFISVDEEGALKTAAFMDLLRRRNARPSRFAGIPISVKDLFDVAGQVTMAGSVVLKDNPRAEADAPAIARLRAKGFVILGRSNMTEFAYSGVGLNPHYGTPLSPYDRRTRRIPGGSSSGAAVSVADGMCALGIGTDTGGSCRIPASFCGVVGYKPSVRRIPTEGAYPLSTTFDSVGSLARSVRCTAIADAIMGGDWNGKIDDVPLTRIRLGLPESLNGSGVEPEVAKAFDRAVSNLSKAGASIVKLKFPSLEEIAAINSKGGILAVEAYAHHKELIASQGERYDPRVRRRILNGANIPAYEYVDIQRKRASLSAKARTLMSGVDGVIVPTTPNIPPAVAALDKDDEYIRINFLSLRHTFVGNFLEMCAISLPMHEPEEPPSGLMVLAPWGADVWLFAAALAIERVVVRR
jgi:aspartyl-tRNA(Asn)/glutamyl-tRNA(Gln) amidotransferase subunit A